MLLHVQPVTRCINRESPTSHYCVLLYVQDGDKKHVEALAIRLRDHGGMRRFKNALFECLDHKHEDIACLLIKLGFSTEVYKQVLALVVLNS